MCLENQPISWATELCLSNRTSSARVYGLKWACIEQRSWKVGIGELCVIHKRTSSSANTSKAKWSGDPCYIFAPRSGEQSIASYTDTVVFFWNKQGFSLRISNVFQPWCDIIKLYPCTLHCNSSSPHAFLYPSAPYFGGEMELNIQLN